MKISDLILAICFIGLMFCLFMLGLDYGMQQTQQKDVYKEIFRDVQFYPRTEIKCINPRISHPIGSSMQPYIYAGDTIYLDTVNFSDVNLGDVISFNTIHNSSTLHAVIAIYPDYLITAGYNNIGRDTERVYAENITGRVCIP